MNECLVLDHSIIEEGEEKLSNRVCLLVNIEMAYSCMACCFNIFPLQTRTVHSQNQCALSFIFLFNSQQQIKSHLQII